MRGARAEAVDVRADGCPHDGCRRLDGVAARAEGVAPVDWRLTKDSTTPTDPAEGRLVVDVGEPLFDQIGLAGGVGEEGVARAVGFCVVMLSGDARHIVIAKEAWLK